MIVRWVSCCVALDENNNPAGIIYGGTSTFPNPQVKTSEKVTQTLQTMPRIEQVRHPPTQEQLKKAYGQ